jgi:glucose-6-phosphate isomerase
MLIDVTASAGFDLNLDSATGEVHSDDGFRFRRTVRTAGELKGVLRSPEAVAPDAEMYSMYYLESAPAAARAVLEPLELTYSPVLVPPGKAGVEFVKTSGHYHPPIPGTAVGYPEVYTGLHGLMYLFMQKRDPAAPDTPLDCALIELRPGVSVMIPPDYAHVLINPTDEMALMAGLYCAGFKPDYAEVIERRGLAYYLVQGNGGIVVEPNRHYHNPPPLQHPAELVGTIFEPPDRADIPLWSSFMADPERYAFLARPDAVLARFG